MSAAEAAKSTPEARALPVRRQIPKVSEVRELLQFRAPVLDPVRRRLEAALTIEDLRRLSRRTTPGAVFDYVDGGAESEVTAERNRAAFRDAEFMPEGLNPVADPDLSTDLLGERIDFPLAFAPTGYTRMVHHEGEAAVARVAARNGIPYALSTVGTTTIEEIRDAAPTGKNWFQLYLTRDQDLNSELLHRAQNAGCRTVILTIDTRVPGGRHKDARNGLTIPPSLTARTFLDMSRFPSWWFNKLTTAPITFAAVRDRPRTTAGVAKMLFEPGLSQQDIVWLREEWPHNLLIKGIISPQDAARVMDLGANGVVVSNHGGRQLDRTPATLDILPEVREAVGSAAAVLLDSGVRNGQDIAAAVARGADAVMIGRAYLYGLMAGGERGVERAVEILRTEYRRGLQLLGLRTTGQLAPHHVRTPREQVAGRSPAGV